VRTKGLVPFLRITGNLQATDRTRKRRYSYTDSMLLEYIRRISEKLFDTISIALRFTFRLEQRRGGETNMEVYCVT